jgi:hypothetical protein
MVLLLLADTTYEGGGLSLAEQPGCRHWCGVEGGTVLSPKNPSLLKKNIRYHSSKEKLIVFIR